MRLIVLNNIPTPYRDRFFARLAEACARNGLSFEVWYMAETEPGRSWNQNDFRFEYPTTLLRGVSPFLRGIPFHLNPGVFFRLIVASQTVIVIAGGWTVPTAVLALVAGRLRRSVRAIAWLEANRWYSARKGAVVNVCRRAVLGLADAYAVPGQEARDTIETVWKAPDRPWITLRNAVEAIEIATAVAQLRRDRTGLRTKWGALARGRILLIPARLDEKLKGIVGFLRAVEGVDHRDLTILIAGDGPDEPRIREWLKERPSMDVRLLGFVAQDGMLELYALCDALALPSLRDPNPLVLVEGLAAGLPLLASCLCGNARDTVLPGVNGWCFDPRQPEAAAEAIAEFLALTDEELDAMGRASSERACEWDGKLVADRLVKDVLTL